MARGNGRVIAAAIEKLKANRPVIAAILAGMQAAARDPSTTIDTAQIEPRTAEHVAEAVAPIIANARNSEPPRESRVVSGSSWAIIGGLGMVFTQLGPMLEALETGLNSGSKWAAVLGFVFGGGAFGGGAFALFGRLRKDLPPMHRRWWNPFSWLAPKAA